MTTFKAGMIKQYIDEIYGGKDVKDPLIFKNISQRTKYHLRMLGEELLKHDKKIVDQLREVFEKHYEMPYEEIQKTNPILSEEKMGQFKKDIQDVSEIDIEIQHFPFKEADFIDKSTNDVIAGNGVYYNLIDVLVYNN